MREKPLHLDRLIDAGALVRDLDALAEGGADRPEVRGAVLVRLKRARADGLRAAEAMLADDRSGRACVLRISALTDVIVRALHHFAVAHVFKARNLSASERMGVCATGGYGRGMLSPSSDLDLLFLLPAKQTALGESVVEYMLYMLWDMGLTVGHATRTVADCVKQAKADMTIRTALLESRHLSGEEALHDELVERYGREVMAGTAREFVAAKLAERDRRHAEAGRSRYLVEPNVKEGKGALRDLQTLYWIAKYVMNVRTVDGLVEADVLAREELARFRKAQDFLWAVRSHMHFETGRETDILRFDLQPAVAARLGFTDGPGLSGVERFMKRYFLAAREVGDLTRIVCAELEEREAKAPHVAGLSLDRIGVGSVTLGAAVRAVTRRSQTIAKTEFVARNGRIALGKPDLFEQRPVAMLEMFAVAEAQGLLFHPDAMHALNRNLPRIDRSVREDADAVAAFMAVLTSTRDPEGYLRRMNESGLLGRFVPEFGRIVALMQFSMYHHYTVDEHTIRAIGMWAAIRRGELEGDHPLVTGFRDKLDPRIMGVALLCHDIAKGRDEDHSIAGARLAKRIAPRLGLTPDETETVSWLVLEHLTMSNTAQSRDLSDFGTVSDFARRVQTMDRLRHLLALTCCDIRAVGPGTWNGWKGQLLRTLYHEAEPLVTGGFAARPIETRARERRESLFEALVDDGMNLEDARRVAALHSPSYLLSTSPEDQVRHASFVVAADARGDALTIDTQLNAFEGVTTLDVLAPDHPHLFSIIAGACAAADANIVGAKVSTTADGRALNTILVTRAFDRDEDETRRAALVASLVRDVLAGRVRVPDLVAQRAGGARAKGRRAKPFDVTPVVRFDNDLSNAYTVVEIEGADRPGLLSEITDVLAQANLDIGSAQVVTFGEKIVDAFYVRDLIGAKVTSETRLRTLRERLLELFETAPALKHRTSTSSTMEIA